MDFFESQYRARKHTTLLVVLFVMAVVALIGMANLLVLVVFGYVNRGQTQSAETLFMQLDWQTVGVVSVGVGVVVVVGSLYKIMALSSGGRTVAEALGGQLIPRNTNDTRMRKLLNVVEEMAIASGTPAPPVYLLADEPGINAFAAGFSPQDAIIGVTQGTIDHLDREQLQGVIAHEFSHILNGDMALNVRLIGVLNGILILGLAGYYLLYATSLSRRGRGGGKSAAGILALALGLITIGFAGTFFGGLIKAAVNREREYLADASAVQFTRNPNGIAGALRRIGGYESGSRVESPGAAEVSHAFFAQGVSGFMQGLTATHPPLARRILRIDPHWNGEFDSTDRTDLPQDEAETGQSEPMTREQLAENFIAVATGVALADVESAIDQIGRPNPAAIDYARSLIAGLPSAIKEAAREPYGARAVMYSLVLDQGQAVRDTQLEYLHTRADPDVVELTHELMSETDGLDIEYRLPLIDLSIPALKQLSLDQYLSFKANLSALIEMDDRVDLLEWSLQQILVNHLDGQFLKPVRATTRHPLIGDLKPEIALTLSVLAHAGQQDPDGIKAAFDAAATSLDISGLQLVANDSIGLPALDRALQKLETLNPRIKPRLLKAFAASILRDQTVHPLEIELLRAFCDVLGCPMPPIAR